MRLYLLTILLTFSGLTTLGQTQIGIDSLLDKLSGQSENITNDSVVIKLIANGEKFLPILSTYFTDSKTTSVFSKCNGRYLTQGELAIILADRIETMPYYLLTGLQNCMLQSCDNNPNFVEYYLEFIKFRGITKIFQMRYNEWLLSSDRQKYSTNK